MLFAITSPAKILGKNYLPHSAKHKPTTVKRIYMALIITKSSEAQSALILIGSEGIEAIERLDGIEVADADAEMVSILLDKEFIIHVIEY